MTDHEYSVVVHPVHPAYRKLGRYQWHAWVTVRGRTLEVNTGFARTRRQAEARGEQANGRHWDMVQRKANHHPTR